MASSRDLLTVLLSVILSSSFPRAEYEPAGCSDEGCGIPCYMRPVEDPCHYQPHSPCNEEGSTDLEQWLGNLNSSLHRLANKLIQKGVIPAGDTCKPLHPIDHGGVIYSDLILSPGVIANYVCEDSYSIHGNPSRTCGTDGNWIGSEGDDPVCEESLVECNPLLNIPYGHVHYSSVDTTTIEPGDVVTYSCDPPYILEGAGYRICMSNATWSEEEPQCTEPSTSGQNATSQGTSNKTGIIVGGIIVAMFLTLITVTVILLAYFIYRRRRKGDYEPLAGDRKDTKETIKHSETSSIELSTPTETITSS